MSTDRTAGFYRLFAWLSPSFPTGGFSYSHGLEASAVAGRAGLQAWIAAILAKGSGRIDADILRDAYKAAAAHDLDALDAAGRRGAAYRATAELALESGAQGAAFLAAVRAAWPDPFIEEWAAPTPSLSRSQGETLPRKREREGWGSAGEGVCHAAVVGAAAACAGVGLADGLVLYLQSFAANLMSAGLRLGLIGQTDGQRILAALEPTIRDAAAAAIARDEADFGAAGFAADLASMTHETQYSRLFRS